MAKRVKKKKKAKKKVDWSKIFTTIIALGFGAYGIWCGIEYYELCNIAILNDGSMPDSTLAVTCVTVVIGSLVSYLLYNGFLKNSRNKYGVDSEGVPYDMISEEEVNDFKNDFDH